MDSDNSNGNGNFLDRVALYRQFDEARHQEIETLAQQFQEVSKTLDTVKKDLEDEAWNRRKWRARAEDAESAVSRNHFALVLIDGDGYIFQNAFLRNPNDGGPQAAHELYTEVQNWLKSNNHVGSAGLEIEVMINVYINKQGLMKALYEAEMISSLAQFEQFLCSFNQSRSLFQIIDCGHGKERVDAKLRDTFRFYTYNAQCKHIFLACCHDNGYVAELDKYRHDPIAKEKIILVKHDQSARQYTSLPYLTAKFQSVFAEQTSLIPVRRTDPFPAVLNKKPFVPLKEISSETDLENPSRTSPVSYSSVMSNTVTLPLRNNGFTTVTSTKPPANGDAIGKIGADKVTGDPKGIPVNRFGQRLDRRMPPPSAGELDRFDARCKNGNLCNQHHLTDSGCYSYACRYDHDPIEPSVKKTLRFKARTIPCGEGAACRKVECFFGHQCPWGNDTCTNPKCVFYKKDLHNISDLEIAKFVPGTMA